MADSASTATMNAWLHPLASAPAASMSERQLRALEAHVAAEVHDLAGCQAVAEETRDPVVRLLVGMIVEDEKRHHSLLELMINRLHEEVEFVPSISPLPVPSNPGPTRADKDPQCGWRATRTDSR